MSRTFLMLGTVGFTFFAGCTAYEAHWDSVKMREHAVDYYADEIIDNLVRARKGLVFVHVDISSQSAAVNTKLPATIGVGQTLTRSATAALSNAVRPFTASFQPENDNALTINTSPVVGDADVYRPYIQFLNLSSPTELLAHAPSNYVRFDSVISLQTTGTDHPPTTGFVEGTVKKGQDGFYYFVPESFRRAYSELCVTLMARDTEAKPSGDSHSKPKSAAKPDKSQKSLQKQLKLNGDKLQDIQTQQYFQSR